MKEQTQTNREIIIVINQEIIIVMNQENRKNQTTITNYKFSSGINEKFKTLNNLN